MVPGPPTEDAAMKVQVEMEVQPFTVPNFVLLTGKSSTGDGKINSIPLKDLSREDLTALCNEFRVSVFKAAGQTP